jgi:hypothetical protein
MKKTKSALVEKVTNLFEGGVTVDCIDLRKMISSLSYVEDEKKLEKALDNCKAKIKSINHEILYRQELVLKYANASITDGVLLLKNHGFPNIEGVSNDVGRLKKLLEGEQASFKYLKELELLCADNEKRVIVKDKILRKLAIDNTHIHFNTIKADGKPAMTVFMVRNGNQVKYKNFFFISDEDKKELEGKDISLHFVRFLKYFSEYISSIKV